MERGNRVRYTMRHWLWLTEAGRVPKTGAASQRIDFCGTVLDAEDGTVTVEWDTGRPVPRRGTEQFPALCVHLDENLEATA